MHTDKSELQVGEWRGFLSDADREYIEKFNLNYLMYSGMVRWIDN
jgi:hypothetical protein